MIQNFHILKRCLQIKVYKLQIKTCYSVQLRDRKFVKGYGFLCFTKNIGKNISKNISSKYSQKLLDHAKQSATDALKTSSKRVIQKTAGATGDLIGKKC